MGILITGLAVVVSLQWAIILTPGPRVEDSTCPAQTVRVRYPESMADYKDEQGHYRIAYCKPTGIVWAKIGE